jgi:DNA-binding NarL/FixJ family response regulator
MSKESKKRSLSYRVTTPEERAKRQTENEKRSAGIMALKAQGLSFSVIAVRMGLSSSSVSRIAREHARQLEDRIPSMPAIK